MSEDPSSGAWRWKVRDRNADRRLRLLYEPGNWGDMLKGIWAIAATRWLIRSRRLKVLHYLDPFAGAPAYPLTEAAAARLAEVSGTELARLQAPFARRGMFASAASLVGAAAERSGARPQLRVFDLDPECRAAWGRIADAEVLSAASGLDALDRAVQSAPDLVLLDPYDLLAEWKEFLPRMARAAKCSAVLAYVYNRSPRSAGYWNEYRRFREQLEASLKGSALTVGRVPCDAVLPRAYHEMIVLGTSGILRQLGRALGNSTKRLARKLAQSGAFEQIIPQ
jgi:hypothetical protein